MYFKNHCLPKSANHTRQKGDYKDPLGLRKPAEMATEQEFWVPSRALGTPLAGVAVY